MPIKTLSAINYIALSFFLVVIVDLLVLQGYLKTLLPQSPTVFAWYHILFGLPHIIASFVSYANKEYLVYYKQPIIHAIIITLSIIAVFMLFAPSLLVYFFIGYTLYHFSRQQVGLCRRYLHNTFVTRIWSISGVITSITLALSVGGEGFAYVPREITIYLQGAGIISLIVFIITSVYFAKRDTYVITSSAIIILASVCILFGYYAVGILMLVFTHDTSAFAVYTAHDTNYQQQKNNNRIYSLLHIHPRYIVIVLPGICIGVGYLLMWYSVTLFFAVALFLSLMHYYLEAIIWKKGTLHRNMLE